MDKLVTALAVGLLSIAAASPAATLIVTSAADGGSGSLRSAVGHANDGDTIVFDPSLNGSTLTLTRGEIAVKNSIDIEGPGPALLAVSGGDATRIFNLAQAGIRVTIAGLTLTHGLGSGAQGGGAILSSSASLALSNAVLSYNRVLYAASGQWAEGGAISQNDSASLVAANTRFLFNAAVGGPGGFGAVGGAIASDKNSSLVLTGCLFQSNLARGGDGAIVTGDNYVRGGISAGGAIMSGKGGTLEIASSVFDGNQSIGGSGGSVATLSSAAPFYALGTSEGGAIDNHNDSVMTITASTFTHNLGQGGSNNTGGPSGFGFLGVALGGAINNQGTATITGSLFDDNSAVGGGGNGGAGQAFYGQGAGGAIFSWPNAGPGDMVAVDVTFSDNAAAGGAGNAPAPRLFSGEGMGGAIAVFLGASTTLHGGSLVGNAATGGSGPGVGGAIANTTGSTVLVDGSALQSNTAGGGAGGWGGAVWNDGPSVVPFNAGVLTALSIRNASITGNTAATDGGGVYATPGGSGCASGSTISGNAPDNLGGQQLQPCL